MFDWGDNRRFNSYAGYIKRRFGQRVQKLTIDAGFTCPNRDGTLAKGGCTYCNNSSFNPSYCEPEKPIIQQLEEGIQFHAFRYRRADHFLAYFQAFSNTYAPLSELKRIYGEALLHPKVSGIILGTRPDCVDEEKLDYLATLNKNHYVAIEFGVESTNNQTLRRINRGHGYEKSVWAIEEAAKRGLDVGAHFIIGLPGEKKEDILAQVSMINKLPLTTIKFHQLQIVKNTVMAAEYTKNPADFTLFDREEYLELIMRMLERLNPAIVVERFTSEVPPDYLIAPIWGKERADQILVEFEKMLEENDTWQGKHYTNG